MEPSGSAQLVNEEAAQWVARIDSRPLDKQAKADLERWLARDDRHRGALFRTLALLQMAGDSNAIESGVWEVLDPHADVPEGAGSSQLAGDEPLPSGPRIGRRRILWAGAALAASAVPVAFLSGVLSGDPEGSANNIKTQVGQTAHVALEDGSLAIVNTASRLDVRQSPSLRSVRLDEGEAWFQVAKDAARPFVVSVGDVRVRAVGTAFSVRKRDNGADVQVTEGTVEVWTEAQSGRRLRVSAGTSAFVSETHGVQGLVKDPAEVERQLSWRSGVLRFDGNTLREAADEFNRYNLVKLQIDPALGDERVIGRFNSGEPSKFAEVVATAFGARVEKKKGRIEITKS